MFIGEFCFNDQNGASGLDLALAAEDRFRAAGYETNITGDVDPYTNAAWLIVALTGDESVLQDAQEIAGTLIMEYQVLDELDDFWRDRLHNPESEHP